MRILKNNLGCDLKLRTEMDFPVKGIEYIDINPLLIDGNLLSKIDKLFVEELNNKNIDYIVCPEARGFLFGSMIASSLKVGLIPVRKKGKLAPSTVEMQFSYEKEYGKDVLELPKLVDNSYRNKNYYLIDDIYATGNTLNSLKEAIISLGGNVVGVGVIINIVELNNDKDVFSLVDVNED